eukprot:969212_1
MKGSDVGSDKVQTLSKDYHLDDEELARLRKWMTCISLVDFDLVLGQVMKFSYPLNRLTLKEQNNVCSLSFPDSHSSAVGDTSYCFRFRSEYKKRGNAYDSDDHTHQFGYVFFRQRKDDQRHRGYFQQSVVVITPLPFMTFFLQCIHIIGPMFFEYGEQALELACRSICDWPSPSFGCNVELPLLGQTVNLNAQPRRSPVMSRLNSPHRKSPASIDFDAKFDQKTATIHDLASHFDSSLEGGLFQELNLYKIFRGSLGNLWFLWELVITGRSILVVSKKPERCSEAVLGLLSLVSPLVYKGDYRPFFTIYDPDFKSFCSLHDHKTLRSVILGVTNPFFLKVFAKFPAILLLGMSSGDNATPSRYSMDSYRTDSLNSDYRGSTESEPASSSPSAPPKHRRCSSGKTPTFTKQRIRAEDLLNSVNLRKLVCEDSPILGPDKSILKRLMTFGNSQLTGYKESEETMLINNMVLRKHFRELTTRFLRPFEKYFSFNRDIFSNPGFNPYLCSPKLPKFQEEELLDDIRSLKRSEISWIPLRSGGVVASGRKSLVRLYELFLRSPHFNVWLNRRREEAERRLKKLIHTAIKLCTFKKIIDGIALSDAVRMVHIIQKWLDMALNTPHPDIKESGPADPVLCSALRSHISILMTALPPKGIAEVRSTYKSLADVDPFMEQFEKRLKLRSPLPSRPSSADSARRKGKFSQRPENLAIPRCQSSMSGRMTSSCSSSASISKQSSGGGGSNPDTCREFRCQKQALVSLEHDIDLMFVDNHFPS